MPSAVHSLNFNFLLVYDPQLVRLGALAERYFSDDPNTCLIKLRQFGELLAQQVAARSGAFTSIEESQVDLLRRLKAERLLPAEAAGLFHEIRVTGNQATHRHTGTHREALTALKLARQLGIWFHRTFGPERNFAPGPFTPPPDPTVATVQLQAELAELRQALLASRSEAERARQQAEAQSRALESAEARALREAEERAVWEQLAQEAEAVRASLAAELAALQQSARQVSGAQQSALLEAGQAAAAAIDLDEAASRVLIDRQLRDRGWEADSETLRHARGVRPIKGRCLAIAEWPTTDGTADYALFIGTQCIGVVEAKRQRKQVSAAIDQAERYAKAFRFEAGITAAGGPWDEYRVPFVFATNGRSYLKQLETESGVWFRDVRRPTNRRRALADWFTPAGLRAELEIDRAAAQLALQTQPWDFGFELRPYQRRAAEAVEAALAEGRRALLLGMATGTGKTKLAIALLYRLLAVKHFCRVCFVVDRSALGEQAAGEFRTTKVVSAKAFADIFNLKDLRDSQPDPETRVHICTVQGLTRRLLYPTEPAAALPIDEYDLLIVDECHRGYLLDREMSDAELSFRSQDDYISKYRRVLEHFDAVKIGLTATPALHTIQIFGEPIFVYSYREAVIDGYLIDHEPPIGIETALSRSGITFAPGEPVEMLDTCNGAIDLVHAPDELHFEVEAFNKQVITEPFNRAVAQELAGYIDPDLPGKTLIFAVNDAHADIVVEAMKQALADRYGEIEDAAVRKITGSVDRVGQLIRAFRNDALPKIAVTVDLLTTGIDVPAIIHLVFLRRVNSRILYEQMLGRATRRCDEIGKETFRIFDAVDLYSRLQDFTEMRPVVVDPTITLERLFTELADDGNAAQWQAILNQMVVLLRRRLKRLTAEAREQYAALAGETPEATLVRLRRSAPPEAVAWVEAHPGLGAILDTTGDGGNARLPISHHPDTVVAVTRGYGSAQRPEDFLDNFTAYIRSHVNKIAALTVVVQRPRELTRAQLRDLRLELDRLGYSDANLRRAWRDARNEDIAASIIGFVRQAALGDALIPYDERVRGAVRRILASRDWTEPQRRWLQRIGSQLEHELVVDRDLLESENFKEHGGFRRLNRIFEGRLEAILGDINEALWRTAP